MARNREQKIADQVLTGAGLDSETARQHREFFIFGLTKAEFGLGSAFAFVMLLLFAANQ